MTETPITRVLIVAPALPMVGGQSVQAARLVDKFRTEPTLTVDLQPVNPAFLPMLQRIKYVRTVVTTLKYLFDLLVRVPRYDVIHVFSASYFSFLLAPLPAVLIAKLFGKRTILNYHSGEAEDHLRRSPFAVRVMGLFDQIITPSGYLVNVFAKFGLTANVIFNFVDADRFVLRKRDPLEPVFLSNRNLEDMYNVGCVVRAFALIQERYDSATLMIAGDGPERNKIVQMADDLQLRNVEFIGSVSQEEMPRIYDRADIYLNGSNIDNMPNSIIEAFAAGTPVVSTNAGGIPYICETNKTAMLVEREDHQAMATAVFELLEDNDFAQEMIVNAHAECDKYSWESVRSNWIKAYETSA